MSIPTLSAVLDEVQARVDHLRASAGAEAGGSSGETWYQCDTIGAEVIRAAVDEVAAGAGEDSRQVAASLLAQSYAHRVGAVSLAAYALGLPWPVPAAANTSVRLDGGRARALRFRSGAMGDPGDAAGLARSLFRDHLEPVVGAVRQAQRLGERLLWANVAASCAAAFRAVEGAARDRGDGPERAGIRDRAAEFLRVAPWLDGTGRFDPASRDWAWQRSACCLWYRTSGGRTCEGCSLRTARVHGTGSGA